MIAEIFKQILQGVLASKVLSEEALESLVKEMAERYGIDPKTVEEALAEAREKTKTERERWENFSSRLPDFFPLFALFSPLGQKVQNAQNVQKTSIRPIDQIKELDALEKRLEKLTQELEELKSRELEPREQAPEKKAETGKASKKGDKTVPKKSQKTSQVKAKKPKGKSSS